jgi:hypothetical protein
MVSDVSCGMAELVSHDALFYFMLKGIIPVMMVPYESWVHALSYGGRLKM